MKADEGVHTGQIKLRMTLDEKTGACAIELLCNPGNLDFWLSLPPGELARRERSIIRNLTGIDPDTGVLEITADDERAMQAAGILK